MNLNFERHTPPTLTRQSLEAERDRRAALRQRNLCLALTALLAVLSNLACWVLLLPYLTTPAGLAAAVGLIASELAGLAALAAFAIVRRDRQWQPLAMF